MLIEAAFRVVLQLDMLIELLFYLLPLLWILLGLIHVVELLEVDASLVQYFFVLLCFQLRVLNALKLLRHVVTLQLEHFLAEELVTLVVELLDEVAQAALHLSKLGLLLR